MGVVGPELNIDLVSETIDGLLPEGVRVETGQPGVGELWVHPEEVAVVAKAVQKRKDEFFMGRTTARRALAGLGVHDTLLLQNEDRSPRWPPGIVGSISHSRSLCATVVARVQDVISLGLDLEPDEVLEEKLWPHILRPAEVSWLEGMPRAEQGRLAHVIFSAKECFYKCQYPLTQTFLEFHQVELQLELADQHFCAQPVDPLPLPVQPAFEGRWQVVEAHIVTAMAV